MVKWLVAKVKWLVAMENGWLLW